MKTFALLFALVVLSAPASAGPYDNQLTMAEWNVATVPQRMGVARMLIIALKPGTAHPMVHTVELRACVDAVAVEPRLGHLKLSDVSLSCAVELGWR